MPTSSNIRQSTAEWIEQNQGMPRKFRILVIGRANAGKTSILRKFCNATGEPMILSPDNEPIDSSTLDPSLRRGEHDIENQMIFESNPDFIFHDSRGFEAGGAGELKLVQEFLKKRSEAKNVNKQLHAIWYCIPTSDDRPITRAEQTFFNEYGTGLVPVILLWTKTDFLDLAKIKQLMKKGIPKPEAMQQAPQQAWADYEKKIYPQFDKFKYPPKAFVVFRKMHEEAAIDFKDLIEKTTAALSTEELRRFFLSTQQNLVEPCIGYGIRRIITSTELDLLSLFKEHDGNWANFIAVVLGYFPQFVSVLLDIQCSLGIMYFFSLL